VIIYEQFGVLEDDLTTNGAKLVFEVKPYAIIFMEVEPL
jgi:hypothetical protein